MPTRGRNTKHPPVQPQEEQANLEDAVPIIDKVLTFLKLFVCETLAKRVVGMLLVAVDLPENQVAELVGLSGKSVSSLKKCLESKDIDSMFHVAGGGRKGKLAGLEGFIVEEINSNNYHSCQQIADMIHEKYGVTVSLPVRQVTKKNGIKRLKCGSLPAKADPVKQRIFYDDVLKPLMNQARAGFAHLLLQVIHILPLQKSAIY